MFLWISDQAEKTTKVCACVSKRPCKLYRGRVSTVFERDGKLIVKGVDTLGHNPLK